MKRFNRVTTVAGFFVRHPNAANLVMAMLILFGAYGLAKLNTQFFPTVETNRINISVSWPGASAEDVEANILQAVEPEVRFIDGVDKVVSYAREGAATVRWSLSRAPTCKRRCRMSIRPSPRSAHCRRMRKRRSVSFRQVLRPRRAYRAQGAFSEGALKVFARRIRDDLIERGIDRVTFSGLRDEEYVVRSRSAKCAGST